MSTATRPPRADEPRASHAKKPRAAYANEVRLIGGTLKRSKLPVADRPGLRPTPDRVRETLFNWLGQDLRGWRVLDAFAGSGALGFEAASRGAEHVVLLENDGVLVASLQASAVRLKAGAIRVQRADALAWMAAAAAESFDAVLLDPPFAAGLLPAATHAAARLLVPGGFLYAEQGEPFDPALPALTLHRSQRAGAVHAHLFVKVQ